MKRYTVEFINLNTHYLDHQSYSIQVYATSIEEAKELANSILKKSLKDPIHILYVTSQNFH